MEFTVDSRRTMFEEGHVEYSSQLHHIRKSHSARQAWVMLRVWCIVGHPAVYRSDDLEPDADSLLHTDVVAVVELADYWRSVLTTSMNLAATQRDHSVHLLDTIDNIVATALLNCIGQSGRRLHKA